MYKSYLNISLLLLAFIGSLNPVRADEQMPASEQLSKAVDPFGPNTISAAPQGAPVSDVAPVAPASTPAPVAVVQNSVADSSTTLEAPAPAPAPAEIDPFGPKTDKKVGEAMSSAAASNKQEGKGGSPFVGASSEQKVADGFFARVHSAVIGKLVGGFDSVRRCIIKDEPEFLKGRDYFKSIVVFGATAALTYTAYLLYKKLMKKNAKAADARTKKGFSSSRS